MKCVSNKKNTNDIYNEIRDSLRPNLRNYVLSITRLSQSPLFVCPLCRSGEGPNRTGAFGIYERGLRWKCQSCGRGGDLFDLIGEYESIPSHAGQMRRAQELFGTQTPMVLKYKKAESVPVPPKQDSVDYYDFFLEANRHIEETNYHRGISLETLNRYMVGYVPEWKNPKAANSAQMSPRLIIPTSRESYFARDARECIPEDQKGRAKLKVGKSHIFNASSIVNSDKPVFIVEGELDALSIIDVGGCAVATGGVGGINTLLSILKSEKPSHTLLVAMDNDDAGQSANGMIMAGLNDLNIPAVCINPYGTHKDANEVLMDDRESLRRTVEQAEREYS